MTRLLQLLYDDLHYYVTLVTLCLSFLLSRSTLPSLLPTCLTFWSLLNGNLSNIIKKFDKRGFDRQKNIQILKSQFSANLSCQRLLSVSSSTWSSVWSVTFWNWRDWLLTSICNRTTLWSLCLLLKMKPFSGYGQHDRRKVIETSKSQSLATFGYFLLVLLQRNI